MALDSLHRNHPAARPSHQVTRRNLQVRHNLQATHHSPRVERHNPQATRPNRRAGRLSLLVVHRAFSHRMSRSCKKDLRALTPELGFWSRLPLLALDALSWMNS